MRVRVCVSISHLCDNSMPGRETASPNIFLFGNDSMSANCQRVHVRACVQGFNVRIRLKHENISVLK